MDSCQTCPIRRDAVLCSVPELPDGDPAIRRSAQQWLQQGQAARG
ncbi:hypothetical protein [Stenotrophomonas tuberculopleuritidis]|nr:hypothetical protein [Stenotrophomonas sp. 704A1]